MSNTDLLMPDELTTLKSRADLLGISYHPSIGLEKLREKVAAAMKDEPDEPKKEVPPAAASAETEGARRQRLVEEATRLVRIRLTCMDPLKKEWDGEILTVGNSLVGTLRKYIPFNADEGWHVPHMMYEELRDRQCQVFVSRKDARGNTVREGKLIKAFAIEVLPPLTAEELHDLAQRQAMAKAID